MARKKDIQATNTKRATGDTVIRRKSRKGETISVGERVCIENNGRVGSQTIVNMDIVNGDLYL